MQGPVEGSCCGREPVLSIQKGDELGKRVLLGNGLDGVNICDGEHLVWLVSSSRRQIFTTPMLDMRALNMSTKQKFLNAQSAAICKAVRKNFPYDAFYTKKAVCTQNPGTSKDCISSA
jgi:hypothetical protein